MDLVRLRQATADQHAATESSVPLMSGSLTRAEYIAMLRRFYRIVTAWDRWADAHAPADLTLLRKGPRRATLLAADLAALGEPAFSDEEACSRRMTETVVAGDSRAVFLGRMYVMEGSTLGGQYIARHVEEQLSLTPGIGNAYFYGYGAETMARWREFKMVLAALPEKATGTVIASARNMFALFAEAMRDENGTETSRVASSAVLQRETSGSAARITP